MLSARQAAVRASSSLTSRAAVFTRATLLQKHALRPLSTSVSRDRAATIPNPNQTLRDIVVQTVKNIGSHREGQQYLKYFTSVSSESFAIIKAGGAILTEHLDDFCQSLLVLHQLGLYPVVVHGAGPQLNKLLEDAGVEPQFEEGIRVTDKKTLSVWRVQHAHHLLLTADYLDRDRWGYVGDVTGVNLNPIEKAIKAGYIPIVPSLALTKEGQVLNVNADVTAASLAQAMKPLKIIYLSEKGGLFRGDSGELISEIFLDQEYDELMAQPWCQRGTRLKIKEGKKLLDTLPRTSSIAIIHPDDLQTELFTISGAGTLIRRGEKVEVASSLSEISDLQKFKDALARGQTSDTEAVRNVEEYLEMLKDRPFKAYFDDAMSCLAIVLQPTESRPFSSWVTLSITKPGWLTNTAENVFQAIEKENSDLVWAVSKDDENLSWFFERSDGSFCVDGAVLFWRGFRLEKYSELGPILDEVKASGFISLGEPSSGEPVAPSTTASSRKPSSRPQQARAFSTSARPSVRTSQQRAAPAQARTFVTETNPNPLGKKNASADRPARVALIGARGYTGQALIDLINSHPYLDLTHVSSRELAGQTLKGYEKREVVYENLSPEDVRDLEKSGEVDCWVMALPNGVCQPFVEAIYDARKASNHKSVIVDLSADYRFDKSWTYGLPELTRRVDIQHSHQHLGGQPTVFGISGYSGAGTKPSPKNDVELLADNVMPYSLTDHIHEREIGNHLGAPVAFMPHVASWFRGIQTTINIPLNKTMTSRDIRQIYQDRYAGEKLVKIGGFAVHSSGKRVVVCSTIDNLLKGAATQCLQNMNLALGFAEYEGIPVM
ncbi:unnamed protein product [Parascedosporium putredinis]|uniref:N-acetyltransferase domain-containing protein n=1 Tax=Parascedosporium putredinis TaxID=1442378 RepID=A0A9P1GV57_9PEZI|nr:unnamed protein product [Parascedosporium putredinis]CAI7988234.1 unnamed protein product [Parascedosporium putredinis]